MTRPMYIFRQSPSDPFLMFCPQKIRHQPVTMAGKHQKCLIEWRRNDEAAGRWLLAASQNAVSGQQRPGGSRAYSQQPTWLYWCRRQTAEEALEALEGIEQAGLVIERQEAPL